MADVEEDHDSAQTWQHFPWIDVRHHLEHHCVINKSLQPGFSVKWEWRYFHDILKLGTEPWRYLTRSTGQANKLRFFQGLLVPLDNLFKDNDKVSNERTIPTLALLAQLSFHTCQRQNSLTSRQSSMMTLCSLVAASFQGYHLMQPTELLIYVDLSGPLPCQTSMGQILISGTQHLTNMQPFINRYHEFEIAWNSVVKYQWHNHIISSQLNEPLIADVIVVLLMAASKANAFTEHGSWWLTFGQKLLAGILYIIALMLEVHLRGVACAFAKAAHDKDNDAQQILPRLSTPQ